MPELGTLGRMATVELLVIGNEILSGVTLDTNSQWLAQRITALGGHITRRTTVLDTPEAIADALHAARDRGADVLVVTGGLGPTFDDITLRAVGDALGRPAAEREDALAFVQRRYQELFDEGKVETAELLPARRKMAAVPAGSDLIPNPVGTAPGALMDADGMLVLCFPGVPRELHAMFEVERTQQALAARFGAQVIRQAELVTPFNDESVLGPLCDSVMEQVPGAYLKSHASTFDHADRIPVTITCSGTDRAEVEARLERARALLADGCRRPRPGEIDSPRRGS